MTFEENRKKFVSDLRKITNFEHLWNFHCLLVQSPNSRMELRESMECYARTKDANENLPFVQIRPRVKIEKDSSDNVHAIYDGEWDNGRLPEELQEPWSEILDLCEEISHHKRGPGKLKVKTRLAIFKIDGVWEAAAALPDFKPVLDDLLWVNRRSEMESRIPDGEDWDRYLEIKHKSFRPRYQRKG